MKKFKARLPRREKVPEVRKANWPEWELILKKTFRDISVVEVSMVKIPGTQPSGKELSYTEMIVQGF